MLSKAYAAIRRFSEDIDLSYDIRELIPDLQRVIDQGRLPAMLRAEGIADGLVYAAADHPCLLKGGVSICKECVSSSL